MRFSEKGQGRTPLTPLERAGIGSNDLNVNQTLLVIGVLVTSSLGPLSGSSFHSLSGQAQGQDREGSSWLFRGPLGPQGMEQGLGALRQSHWESPCAQVREPSGWEGAQTLGWRVLGNCPQSGLTAAPPFWLTLGPAQPPDQGPSIHTCPSRPPRTAEPSRLLSPRSKPRLVPHMCPLGLHMAMWRQHGF